MLLVMDIATAFFGLCAFLFAFGGDTIGESTLLFGGDRWSNTEGAPFFKRITARGWLAILCLLVAIGLVAGKEAVKKQSEQDDIVKQLKTEEENVILKGLISKHISDILALQKESGKTNETLSGINDEIEAHHLLSIESAFKLSVKPLREKDQAVVQIDGRETIPIPSQFQDQMHLVGGDQFYFATLVQNASEADLLSLHLELGDKRYPLFEGSARGFFERTLRLPGNPEHPIPAVISNPLGLRNIWIKVFVWPKDLVEEEDVFRALVLNSPFSKEAKEKYKVIKADMLNVRVVPSPSAALVARLPRGSFVQKIRDDKDWMEVITAEGKQGWVTGKYVAEIE